MEQLTLQQLFGVNCSQDGQVLIIKKSDLPGLTPSANNTAESLLLAILLNALRNFSGYLKDENNQPITDENNNPIEFDNSEIFEKIRIFRWEDNLIDRNSLIYIRYTLVIEFFTAYENS